MNLNNISGVSTIDDNYGQTISGGAFRYDLGNGVEGTIRGNEAKIGIRSARTVGVVNTNPSAANLSDIGHRFTLYFVEPDNSLVGIENVYYGQGIYSSDVTMHKLNGATDVVIKQHPL